MQSGKKMYKRNNRILRLNYEQRHNPDIVLAEFFDNFHLHDLRKNLWTWLETGLCSNINGFEDAQNRNNLIFLYTQLEQLAEASFILHRKKLIKKRKEQEGVV